MGQVKMYDFFRDFCHILTLLPPGASVFHKYMFMFNNNTSSDFCYHIHKKILTFISQSNHSFDVWTRSCSDICLLCIKKSYFIAIGDNFDKVQSLGLNSRNLTRSKISMSSTKFVFLSYQKNKMAALASDWLRHFRLLRNRWTEFNKTWKKARSQCPLPSLCF